MKKKNKDFLWLAVSVLSTVIVAFRLKHTTCNPAHDLGMQELLSSFYRWGTVRVVKDLGEVILLG